MPALRCPGSQARRLGKYSVLSPSPPRGRGVGERGRPRGTRGISGLPRSPGKVVPNQSAWNQGPANTCPISWLGNSRHEALLRGSREAELRRPRSQGDLGNERKPLSRRERGFKIEFLPSFGSWERAQFARIVTNLPADSHLCIQTLKHLADRPQQLYIRLDPGLLAGAHVKLGQGLHQRGMGHWQSQDIDASSALCPRQSRPRPHVVSSRLAGERCPIHPAT